MLWKADNTCIHPLQERRWKRQKHQTSNTAFTWNTTFSRFDLHELDTEALISQRPDCGKNMPKRKPPVHQIPRHRNRSRRPSGNIAIKSNNQEEEGKDGSSALNNMKDGSKSKMVSESKDMCGDTIEKKTMKVGKQKTKTSRLSCYKKKHEINGKNRRNDMRAWRLQMGLLSDTWRQHKSEIWETHSQNSYSWEQENTRTNTVLELCWTRSGGKELLILNTSTNGPSLPRSWQTANASNWWVCTSTTRDVQTITTKNCRKWSRSTRQIARAWTLSKERGRMIRSIERKMLRFIVQTKREKKRLDTPGPTETYHRGTDIENNEAGNWRRDSGKKALPNVQAQGHQTLGKINSLTLDTRNSNSAPKMACGWAKKKGEVQNLLVLVLIDSPQSTTRQRLWQRRLVWEASDSWIESLSFLLFLLFFLYPSYPSFCSFPSYPSYFFQLFPFILLNFLTLLAPLTFLTPF